MNHSHAYSFWHSHRHEDNEEPTHTHGHCHFEAMTHDHGKATKVHSHKTAGFHPQEDNPPGGYLGHHGAEHLVWEMHREATADI